MRHVYVGFFATALIAPALAAANSSFTLEMADVTVGMIADLATQNLNSSGWKLVSRSDYKAELTLPRRPAQALFSRNTGAGAVEGITLTYGAVDPIVVEIKRSQKFEPRVSATKVKNQVREKWGVAGLEEGARIYYWVAKPDRVVKVSQEIPCTYSANYQRWNAAPDCIKAIWVELFPGFTDDVGSLSIAMKDFKLENEQSKKLAVLQNQKAKEQTEQLIARPVPKL